MIRVFRIRKLRRFHFEENEFINAWESDPTFKGRRINLCLGKSLENADRFWKVDYWIDGKIIFIYASNFGLLLLSISHMNIRSKCIWIRYSHSWVIFVFQIFLQKKNLLKIQTSFTHLKKKKIDFLFKKMKKLHYKI